MWEELERTRSGGTTSLYRRTQGLQQSVTEGLQARLSSTTVPLASDQPSPSSGNSFLTQVKFPLFGLQQKRKAKGQTANPVIWIVLDPTRNLVRLIKLKHFMLICIQKIVK